MRRFWAMLTVVLLLASGTSVSSGLAPVQASSHAPAVDSRKQCKTVTKKVHGKKTRVRVCRTVQPKPTATPTPSLSTGIKVDVGGYRLWVRCMGTGSPTVVIEPGIGGSSLEFEPIQPRLAAISRTCIYDRAGSGASDPPVGDYTGTQMVTELHTLLGKLKVPGPYVLAGHSFGGVLVRMYAHTYGSDVAGLILIDSVHEYSCDTGCSDTADFEIATYNEILAETHGVIRGSLGSLPLIVLTAGTESGCDASCWQGHLALQRDLATASSNSVHVVATKSGHGIHNDQPDVVVEAVREVVAAARGPSHLLPPCGAAFEQLDATCVK